VQLISGPSYIWNQSPTLRSRLSKKKYILGLSYTEWKSDFEIRLLKNFHHHVRTPSPTFYQKSDFKLGNLAKSKNRFVRLPTFSGRLENSDFCLFSYGKSAFYCYLSPSYCRCFEAMVHCKLLGRAVAVIPVIPVISYMMKKKSQTCRAAPEKVGLWKSRTLISYMYILYMTRLNSLFEKTEEYFRR
jgi:hypothetical protein